MYGSITESINGFCVSSLAISLKKSFFSESDGGVTVEMCTEPVEGETTLHRLGALKSMSPSCKYGMLWVVLIIRKVRHSYAASKPPL